MQKARRSNPAGFFIGRPEVWALAQSASSRVMKAMGNERSRAVGRPSATYSLTLMANRQDVIHLTTSRYIRGYSFEETPLCWFLCAQKLIGINRIPITLHLWHVICTARSLADCFVVHDCIRCQFRIPELWFAGQADLDGPVAYPRRATVFARAPQGTRAFFSSELKRSVFIVSSGLAVSFSWSVGKMSRRQIQTVTINAFRAARQESG